MKVCAIQLYWWCDALSGALIVLMVVFSPWAFGSTEHWSIWVMNSAGYTLGALLTVKVIIRRLALHRPTRWDGQSLLEAAAPNARGSSSLKALVTRAWLDTKRLTRFLAFLTLLICSYCLLSAWNARATYHPRELSFAYHRCLTWLPQSLDSTSSWFAFWSYLGLACSFWSMRDWLSGSSATAAGSQAAAHALSPARTGSFEKGLPARLKGLLCVLCINGALLGLEAIAQRFWGDGRLLFAVRPRFNPEALAQFGPFAYRGNAAQYLNLLWPVCLGFWWTQHCLRGNRRAGHNVLLVCASLIAAGPLISSTRGGALVSLWLAVGASWIMFIGSRRSPSGPSERRQTGRLLLGFLAGAVGLGFGLGWKTLGPRLAHMEEDFVFRQQIYEKAKRMATDYPWFGTGPGTFENVFQFYRGTSGDWPAQVHNDWLETRITFGWVGGTLLVLALGMIVLRGLAGNGGIAGTSRLVPFVLLAMTGVLAHARYDFPFQVHSILFEYVLLSAVVFVAERASLGAR
jgi:O-antigen ligase